ncbi:MAG: ATPase, partial [Ruminococcaceae bacterium]|nr:ATPase [Oscillospiraceae bacterium]
MKEKIRAGKTFLGIELGSTRIKASLIDDTYTPIAGGSFDWENALEDGYWTYSLEAIHKGVQACFANLAENVLTQYNMPLKTVGAIGVSAMMHGYLAFDKNDNLLVPFRTWRNTTTKEAADQLTEAFRFNIPQRWSIAHLYQAILNQEPHVPHIARITTLAGYIHYLLSGNFEVGIGDAS